MTDHKFAYAHIVVEVEGINLDGLKIDANNVAQGIVVSHEVHGHSTVTLILYAEEITVSD